MFNKILRVSLVQILLLFIITANAQILEPVKWSFSSERISDTEFDLIFRAEIDNNWHLYSQDIPMSPPATNFNFDQGAGYELVGKTIEESEVIEEYDSNFEMVLKFFAFEAVFKQRVKLLSDTPVKVKGYLEFNLLFVKIQSEYFSSWGFQEQTRFEKISLYRRILHIEYGQPYVRQYGYELFLSLYNTYL